MIQKLMRIYNMKVKQHCRNRQQCLISLIISLTNCDKVARIEMPAIQ
jgi:hypothetical protein